MQTATKVEGKAIAEGLAVKRANAVAALISGGSLALLSALVFPLRPYGLLGGFLLGLLYANGFEYFYHRFLLHRSQGYLGGKHLSHHSTWGAPDEARYVNFAGTPWAVALLFVINAVPVFALEALLQAGLPAGVLAGFVAYFLAFEEVHWQVHMARPLPRWLRAAQRHHFRHHAGAESHFNVFLPVFDWLLGTRK